MRDITLFATYWNEKEWIDTSLAQIKKINPKRVVICDGCFDSSKENRSTDGTRSKIKEFIKEYSGEAYFFEAIRVNKWKSLNFLSDCIRIDGSKVSLGDYYWSLRHILRTNSYRINQAITFSMMMKMVGLKEGDWFMTYDADQFYSDEIIRKFDDLGNENFPYDLLCANEYTFFDDFDLYSDHYEKRKWNNMPHRLISGSRLLPTRDFKVKNSMFGMVNYYDIAKKIEVGNYFHYKFREDKKRVVSGYELGDRKPPEKERAISSIKYKGKHPQVIIENFDFDR
ncbi:hypothetical protein [Vibrio splendidus]|uniref:hypothetical protein n=1 Tax=Vibrio splendidus TaxID=29497 RepID=UPI000D33A77B|nr:hypothetical protein [Vibrio splendidus]PTP29386.1 hypothetical protein CWN92_11770 [Vibrio splendidus]